MTILDGVPEVLIVGAGSAGCVLAERLTRDRSITVHLFERGPATAFDSSLDRLPIDVPARAVAVAERRGRPVMRGAGLGGSSAINGGYFLRGHADDYTDWPWTLGEIASAFDDVEQFLRVAPFAQGDLGDVALAFEAAQGGAVQLGLWPTVGLNRVRSNRHGNQRWTTAHALAAAGQRPNLTIRGEADVVELIGGQGRVRGVRLADGSDVMAGEIVLCAGTVGTARLLAPFLGVLPLAEHVERIIRFTARRPLRAPALLQTVAHTADGLEIRPYGDELASFTGLPVFGVAVGVADMAGMWGTAGDPIDLGQPDATSVSRLGRGLREVTELLGGPHFEHLVEPGSVRIDPVPSTSQHAWGTLPAGRLVDRAGALSGIDGLRVVDGSILPGPLRSGPHATITMLASLIGSMIR